MNAYKIETMCQQTCLVPVIDKESNRLCGDMKTPVSAPWELMIWDTECCIRKHPPGWRQGAHKGSSGPLSAIWAWNSSASLQPAEANQVLP